MTNQDSNGLSTRPDKVSGETGLIIFLILGVVFPTIAIGAELLFHLCAETFFNPFPDIWHGLLIVLVPILNMCAWLIWKKGKNTRLHTLLFWINGLSIGISAYYTVLFLPIMFFSIILIAFMGIGLLPLAPAFAFIAGILFFKILRKSPNIHSTPRLWRGIALAFVLLAALDAPNSITRVALSMANSETPSLNRQGLFLLKTVGRREEMLRACYERPGFATDIVGSLTNAVKAVPPENARKIYYQVTGAPFNSVRPPRLTGRGAGIWTDDWYYDESQGGQAVAAVIKGLSLNGSRLDTSIDPNAALSYTEWTLNFINHSKLEHEARAQILLPPGGVVSRLTLWVDGEEREAAFAKRSAVRTAYQKVVHSQRDPVLVTTTGPNRVLVQCYPVPPDEGAMKIRIGITAPLILADPPVRGRLMLPVFIERNFSVPANVRHSVWVESTQEILSSTKKLISSMRQKGVFTLRGFVNETELEKGVPLTALRNQTATQAWTPLPKGKSGIRQTIIGTCRRPVNRLFVVLDGSSDLRGYRNQIADWLKAIPGDKTLHMIIADDPVRETSFAPDPDRVQKIQSWLYGARFEGGKDNLPALERAYDRASAGDQSAILWIHGPQPVLFEAPDALEQQLERNPDTLLIDAYQIIPGPNRIMERLGNKINAIDWSGNEKDDLTRYLSVQFGKKKEYITIRELSNLKNDLAVSNRTSSHLGRLWAYHQVLQLLDRGKAKDRDQAAVLAASFQLVTPVSGAVVLENEAQYKDAGLKPVDPESVPTVPEPEGWVLSIITAIIIFCCYLLGGKRFRRALC